MKLIVRCPVCSQSLIAQVTEFRRSMSCPSCRAKIPVRRPRLSEQEIMKIIGSEVLEGASS